MDSSKVYSAKAEQYAKHRWDYHAAAIQTIVDTAQLTAASCVADLGAGTGIFTRHLAPVVARIYAVEPNTEMREQAQQVLAEYPSCVICTGSAEDTGLPAAGIDLITQRQFTRRLFRKGANSHVAIQFDDTEAAGIFHRFQRDTHQRLCAGMGFHQSR
jgi:ubiquinone/menaquinone biosynthesis C-methylase UbiE